MPAFNAARQIGRALYSLAMQTDPVKSIVIVDDGSTDETVAVAERWAERLPITIVRLAKRGGPSAARRLGIRHLSSRLVMQLDADDLMLPNHVAQMRSTYSNQLDLVSARPLHWHGDTNFTFDSFHDARPGHESSHLVQLILRNYVSCGCLFGRDLYDQVGEYQDIRYAGDWDLWLRMVHGGACIKKPNAHTYVYQSGLQSYTNAIHWDVHDIPILDRFLAAQSPNGQALRRVIKFALLGRMGRDYLRRCELLDTSMALPAAEAIDEDPPRLAVSAAVDRDIGTFIETQDELILVAQSPIRVIWRANIRGSKCKVTYVEDDAILVPAGPVLSPVSSDFDVDFAREYVSRAGDCGAHLDDLP